VHWAVKYIGLKYRDAGRGPDVFDCWGLVVWIYGNEFRLELPSFPNVSMLLSAPEKISEVVKQTVNSDWIRIESPEDGCAVALGQFGQGRVHHVGVYASADGGKVLHSWKGNDSAADSLKALRMKGFRLIQFYRHRLWPT
jgi:cell wall-associated NlpC family hydrolase